MRLKSITIENYKSLKSVKLEPGNFSVLVGANAAGKTNFSDALDFVSQVYKHGLEHAVAIKGGYENIAFRKQRRSKAPIEFSVVVEEDDQGELKKLIRFTAFGRASRRNIAKIKKLIITHKFSFQTSGTGIKADFRVADEYLRIQGIDEDVSDLFDSDDEGNIEIMFERDNSGVLNTNYKGSSSLVDYIRRRTESYLEFYSDMPLSKQQLLVSTQAISNRVLNWFAGSLSKINIYKLTPELSRQSGVPTPNPELGAMGQNLPAMVDWLQRKYPKLWNVVESAMQDIVPDLEEISVQYLHTKTLGLFFKEFNVGRYWSSDDVSDGTIQALAMLVALVDPRSSLLLIEEPENSVHPWILKSLLRRFRDVSKQKSVIITTHSPIVIDAISPKELWIVFKKNGETNIVNVLDIDPSIGKDWEEGSYRLSDYIDSGSVREVVPGGVI